MRFRKMEAVFVALLRQSVHNRAARVTEPHHLGAFVEGFANSVIDGLSENLVFQRTVHPDNLRVSAGNQKAQIGKLRCAVFLVVLLYEVCKYVSLKVVHFNQRTSERDGKRLCERRADQQRTQKSRTAGERDCSDVLLLDTGPVDGLAHHRHNILLVCA